MPESHAHGEDTGANTAVIRHLITDNGTGDHIHDEPDIAFDSTHFDVGLIGGKSIACIVVIMINKRVDDDCSGSGIVGHLLMGYLDVVQVFECLSGLTERQSQIRMVRQRDMMCALCLLNFREEAFFGRLFKSMRKKSTENWR